MSRMEVTWLGEDIGDTPGPSFNIWGDPLTQTGVKFEKGVTVTLDDEAAPPRLANLYRHIMDVAPSNRFYECTVPDHSGEGGQASAAEAEPEEDTEEPHRRAPRHPPGRRR